MKIRESDAPPPTGDNLPRSLGDLEDIPFRGEQRVEESRRSAHAIGAKIKQADLRARLS